MNGFIVQWGIVANLGDTGTRTISQSFTTFNEMSVILISPFNNGDLTNESEWWGGTEINTITTSSFTARLVSRLGLQWIAIGKIS